MVLCRILFFLVLFSNFSFPQEYPDKYINSLLKSGIDNIINQNFNSARADFSTLNSKYPHLPLGKIYLAAVEIAKAYDLGEEYNDFQIDKLLSDAELQCNNLLKIEPQNIWYQYFMGLTKGYISYYEALNGSWLTSLKEALSSAGYLEKSVKTNPNFYEAYSGLGSYKYWKSRKTDFLNWLPFVEDETEEGIDLLEHAVERSFYNTYLAVNSLIWIYIDQKKFHSAVKVSEKALIKYPKSRFFKWGLARAYEDINPQKAIFYYNEILNSFPNLSSMNRYNEIILKHLMAQQYSKIGEKGKALVLCREILAIKKLDSYVSEKLEERLKKVIQLKNKLEEKG